MMNADQINALRKVGQQLIAFLRDRGIQLKDDDYQQACDMLLTAYQRLEQELTGSRQALREILVIAQGQNRVTPPVIKLNGE